MCLKMPSAMVYALLSLISLALADNCILNSPSSQNQRYNLYIRCQNVNESIYLHEIFQLKTNLTKLLSRNVETIFMEISESTLLEIDSWLSLPFADLTLKSYAISISINISNNNVRTIKLNTFDNFQSQIATLDISNNNIKDYTFISNLGKNIKQIFASQVGVNESDNFLYFIQNICPSFLDLSKNNLKEINLSNFYCIDTLDLSFNNISKVKAFYHSPSSWYNYIFDNNNYLNEIIRDNQYSAKLLAYNFSISNINTKFNLSILQNVSISNSIVLKNNQILELNLKTFRLSIVYDSRDKVSLDLSNSSISNISVGYFENYVIDKLNLSQNNINILNNSTFLNAKIDILDLNNANIKEVDKNAFCKLVVNKLLLANNNISEVAYNLFSVIELDLSGNPIKYIDSYTFQNCSNLQILNLSKTYVPKIFEDSFKYLPTLTYLELSTNGIVSANQIKNIYLSKLVISHSNISRLVAYNFKGFYSLKELHFKDSYINNNISNLALRDLYSLTYLDSQNLFKNCKAIPKGIFADLYNLQNLDLSYLEIEFVEEGTFKGLENSALRMINVTGSKIEKDLKLLSKLIK